MPVDCRREFVNENRRYFEKVHKLEVIIECLDLQEITFAVDILFGEHLHIVTSKDEGKDGKDDGVSHSDASEHERPSETRDTLANDTTILNAKSQHQHRLN